MSEAYDKQLETEKLNKEILSKALLDKDRLIEFYKTHNRADTKNEFGFRTDKQLVKALTLAGYDFSIPKSLSKGKPSLRSHESYIAGGKKSAETQKERWQSKSEEEKAAWSKKMSACHMNNGYKAKITETNRNYRLSLTPEQRRAMDDARSQTLKQRWASMTQEERDAEMQNRFKNGQTYHIKDSTINKAFAVKLDMRDISYQREYCLDAKFFDFKIGDFLVELDPTITHNITFQPFENKRHFDKDCHKNKTKLAADRGFRCIHVFDWDDPDKIISAFFLPKETIYARSCSLREATKEEAKEFLNANHLQGYARDEVRLCLTDESGIVSMMTFGKPRYNKSCEWELIRYCSSKKVIGGGERLFKHFVEKYDPNSIVSYCDLAKFSGEIYGKLGFKELRDPKPSKHWYKPETGEHYTDALLRAQGFSRLVHRIDASEDDLPTNNNAELMRAEGFYEIYDCGQATYVWRKTVLQV